MAKLILRRKTPLTTADRQERAKRYRQYRLYEWVDPYPNVQGTRPEKIVYAYLMQHRIPFVYQSWFRVTLPEYDFDNWYRPDFVIPDAKIIIEVQGFYWHSKPEVIESDAFKHVVYEKFGYRVITWWDFDIESKVDLLFGREPELLALHGKGTRILTGKEDEKDDSAGIRTQNQSRINYGTRQARYKSSSSKKVKSLFSYEV